MLSFVIKSDEYPFGFACINIVKNIGLEMSFKKFGYKRTG